MKKPTEPEGMNGDHQHLRQMIEWNREVGDEKLDGLRNQIKILFWLIGLGVTLAVAILGLLITVALQV